MSAKREATTARKPSVEPHGLHEGDPLTAREVEALALLAAGEPRAAIARRLGTSENTIKTQLASVYRKTGSRNRVQAALHYLEHYEQRRAPREGAAER